MKSTRFGLVLAFASALGVAALPANAEEPSVATFFLAMSKERCFGLSDEHHAMIGELSGEPAPMMGATGFHNEGQRGLDWLATSPGGMNEAVSVSASAEERARMDAVIAEGMKEIFAEHAERGSANAEEIHEAMHRYVAAAGSPGPAALRGMPM